MEKQITSNGNIIRITSNEGYCTHNVHIEKAFMKNENLDKIIRFSIWDDMSFSTYINNNDLYSDITKIIFNIEITDQIYFALNRMLGKDNNLIIDDDDTREIMKNYMEFKRNENIIQVIFHDEDVNKPMFERFKIFIKNIVSDSRSKIEDLNIKYRLVRFFREAEEILINDNHQYSLDEYYEILKYQKLCSGNNPFLTSSIDFYNYYDINNLNDNFENENMEKVNKLAR